MDIVIPSDILIINIMYNGPILTQRDEQASTIICQHQKTFTPVMKLGTYNNLAFRLQVVPRDTVKLLQMDSDYYYYMSGRAHNTFIIMLDKKSKKDLTQCKKGNLCRRFKIYAKKKFNIDPRRIHSIMMHNFQPINLP